MSRTVTLTYPLSVRLKAVCDSISTIAEETRKLSGDEPIELDDLKELFAAIVIDCNFGTQLLDQFLELSND